MSRIKKWFLPAAAVVLVIAAMFVVFFTPENETSSAGRETDSPVSNGEAELRGTDRLVIHAGSLSSETVSFIRIGEDSRIELVSRLGDDGTVKAALGTCQSCNGSPGAYYTQEGGLLKCNNCGLTFPISVLDSPGGGCHPIMMDEDIMQYEGNDLVIDIKKLERYEQLFLNVEAH